MGIERNKRKNPKCDLVCGQVRERERESGREAEEKDP